VTAGPMAARYGRTMLAADLVAPLGCLAEYGGLGNLDIREDLHDDLTKAVSPTQGTSYLEVAERCTRCHVQSELGLSVTSRGLRDRWAVLHPSPRQATHLEICRERYQSTTVDELVRRTARGGALADLEGQTYGACWLAQPDLHRT
jgi:hypothetical protein